MQRITPTRRIQLPVTQHFRTFGPAREYSMNICGDLKEPGPRLTTLEDQDGQVQPETNQTCMRKSKLHETCCLKIMIISLNKLKRYPDLVLEAWILRKQCSCRRVQVRNSTGGMGCKIDVIGFLLHPSIVYHFWVRYEFCSIWPRDSECLDMGCCISAYLHDLTVCAIF